MASGWETWSCHHCKHLSRGAGNLRCVLHNVDLPVLAYETLCGLFANDNGPSMAELRADVLYYYSYAIGPTPQPLISIEELCSDKIYSAHLEKLSRTNWRLTTTAPLSDGPVVLFVLERQLSARARTVPRVVTYRRSLPSGGEHREEFAGSHSQTMIEGINDHSFLNAWLRGNYSHGAIAAFDEAIADRARVPVLLKLPSEKVEGCQVIHVMRDAIASSVLR